MVVALGESKSEIVQRVLEVRRQQHCCYDYGLSRTRRLLRCERVAPASARALGLSSCRGPRSDSPPQTPKRRLLNPGPAATPAPLNRSRTAAPTPPPSNPPRPAPLPPPKQVQSLPGALPAQLVRPKAGRARWVLDALAAQDLNIGEWESPKDFPRNK